jgi:CheY-like chemotaxis protein
MQHSTSVFLVEDDEDDRFFFMNAFKELRHVSLLDMARNGLEALAKLRRAPSLPSVIFVDYNMPTMDGLEFLKEKSKDSSLRNIPVIMLSASLHIREDAFKYGAKAFIDKAGDDVSLLKNLQMALDSLEVLQ